MNIHHKCIVCGQQDFTPLELNSYFGVYTIECMHCRFRQTEYISPDTLLHYYKNHYRGKLDDASIRHWQNEYVKTAEYQYPIIRSHIADARLALDYGGATGELADKLRAISAEVHITEYDENYIPILNRKGYKVFSDDDLLANGRRYDLITCSHVLEHIPNPYELLRTFQSLTRPGSIVYIEVPNDYEGVAKRIYAKGHVVFFDEQSMRNLLDKQKSFAIVDMLKIENGGLDGSTAVILERTSDDTEIQIVRQDKEKIADEYSRRIVEYVHAIKALQKIQPQPA